MTRARRIGVMGGTFDPIHAGHLGAARETAAQLSLDRVILVPAGQPWHRGAPPEASADDRLAMVRIAIADRDDFEASRVDIERPGPTYTVDTLDDLRAAFAAENPGEEAEWFVITGADALAQFMTWREPARILRMARLVAVTRPGHELSGQFAANLAGMLGVRSAAADGRPDAIITLAIPGIDVSSSKIRARVRAGESIEGLVEPRVADYIRVHDLYRDGPS